MKKRIIFIGLVFAAIAFTACQQSNKEAESNETSMNEVVTETKQEADMKFEKAKADLKEEYKIAIANIDKELAVLSAKAENAKDKTKASLEKTMSDLKTEKKDLEKQMNEVGDYTQDKWDDLKSAAENALEKSERKLDSISNSVAEAMK